MRVRVKLVVRETYAVVERLEIVRETYAVVERLEIAFYDAPLVHDKRHLPPSHTHTHTHTHTHNTQHTTHTNTSLAQAVCTGRRLVGR
jgi:hypothetical protein